MLSPSDTIAVNDTILDAFQHSRDYDYARELVPQHDENYFERLWHAIEDLFNSGNSAANNTVMEIPPWFWWSMLALVVLIAGFLLWKYRIKMFGRHDEEYDEDEEISVEDINEVDFDQLIAEAEKKRDYLTLCRLRYLQTLKAVSDASLVTWERYKTPTQYAMEWHDEDFSVMTNHFLRIRYGHYKAYAALAEEMLSRQEALLARINKQEPVNRQQEGGEQS